MAGIAADTRTPRVDLVAPGAQLTSTYPDRGVGTTSGTEPAAGYVAGTAALMRAYRPELSNVDVVRRLLATTAPAPEGPGGRYGHGVVNPYQAVTANLVHAPPTALPNADSGLAAPAERARAAAWRNSTSLAHGLAVFGIVAAGALMALAIFGAARATPPVASRTRADTRGATRE